MSKCIICQADIVQTCKCPRSDKLCKNGHEYHRGDDGKYHRGPSEHGNRASCCEAKDVIEVPVELTPEIVARPWKEQTFEIRVTAKHELRTLITEGLATASIGMQGAVCAVVNNMVDKLNELYVATLPDVIDCTSCVNIASCRREVIIGKRVDSLTACSSYRKPGQADEISGRLTHDE
jgi:hypothetical protein